MTRACAADADHRTQKHLLRCREEKKARGNSTALD